MTLKTDLEQHIRESYKLIKQFEDILRLSDNPKEQARSHRVIEEQRQLINRYLTEYVPLCEKLNLSMPEDIALIVNSSFSVHQQSSSNITPPHPEEGINNLPISSQENLIDDSTYQKTVNKQEQTQQEALPSSLEELKNFPKDYLWGQFFLLMVFLVGIIEGLVGIFDVSPCLRRLSLTVLTLFGGITILGISVLTRFRTRYRGWDRWLVFGLLTIVAGVLSWLTYQQCVSGL